jgi:hypothetical protein
VELARRLPDPAEGRQLWRSLGFPEAPDDAVPSDNARRRLMMTA